MTSPIINFHSDIAQEYGIEAAILIYHLQFWLRFNRNRKKNIRNGKVWMYQSRADIQAFLPFMTFDTIRRTFERLLEKGVILSANYNRAKFDKTLWYAFVDEKKFGVDEESSKIFYERHSRPSKGADALRLGADAQPIPDINKTDIEEGSSDEELDGASSVPSDAFSSAKKKKRHIDHVMLTEEEFENLKERFGEAKTLDLIERLDAYIGSKGKRYRSHYKTLIGWSLKDQKDVMTTKPQDPDKIGKKLSWNPHKNAKE